MELCLGFSEAAKKALSDYFVHLFVLQKDIEMYPVTRVNRQKGVFVQESAIQFSIVIAECYFAGLIRYCVQ